MDNDSGWAAQQIDLICREQDGHTHKVTLPCRWVELVQAWNGNVDAYFLVSGIPDADIPAHPWAYIAFQDAKHKNHHYPVGIVTRQGTALRLMRVPHAKA